MIPKPLHTFLAWAATVLLLGAAWTFADGEAALARLSELNAAWLALALAVSVVQLALSAARWRLTAARLGLPLPFGWAFREYWLSGFVNQALPGGVGGDLLRAWRHRSYTPDRPGAATRQSPGLLPVLRAVAVERAAGYLALLPCAALGAWLWLPGLSGSMVSAALGLAVLAFCLVPWLRPRLAGIAGLGVLVNDLASALFAPAVLPRQLVLSALIFMSYLLVFACAALAVGVPVQPLLLLTGVPLVLLTMAVPVSVGGWGLREVSAAGLWAMAGGSAEAGLAASVAYGVTIFLASLPGALVLLGGGLKPRPAPAGE